MTVYVLEMGEWGRPGNNYKVMGLTLSKKEAEDWKKQYGGSYLTFMLSPCQVLEALKAEFIRKPHGI